MTLQDQGLSLFAELRQLDGLPAILGVEPCKELVQGVRKFPVPAGYLLLNFSFLSTFGEDCCCVLFMPVLCFFKASGHYCRPAYHLSCKQNLRP